MEPPPRQCVISANAEPHYKRSFPRLMVRARGSSYIELNQAAVQYSDSTGPRIRTRQRSKRKRNARSSSHWPSFTSRPLNLHKQDGGDDDDDDVRATNGDAQKGSIADLASTYACGNGSIWYISSHHHLYLMRVNTAKSSDCCSWYITTYRQSRRKDFIKRKSQP